MTHPEEMGIRARQLQIGYWKQRERVNCIVTRTLPTTTKNVSELTNTNHKLQSALSMYLSNTNS